ncbi:TlpA family protein disulfide reductase [bacterium]|nr:TlpA family protein disulfide reductase [bacterium]MBU1753583.1 TlpA family protein disulfide reductase [bacterium]
MNRLIIICGLLIIFASSVFAEAEVLNKAAPDFKLKLLFKTNSLTLNKLLTQGNKQNVLVLSFFDTDCKPCLKEMPQLHQLSQKYQDQAVGVYLINIDKAAVDRLLRNG